MPDIVKHVMAAGFPMAQSSIIHLFTGGSTLYGTKVHGHGDTDIYGCYIEPPTHILGLKTMEHFVTSTGGEGRNSALDVDVTMYSLHNWAKLMMKGNPAILTYLYSKTDEYDDNRTWTDIIKPLREHLVTKKAAKQYLGFADSQHKRLTGEKGMGRHGQRPELIDKYGYDTHFAMHMIRLVYECRELLTERYLTFPRIEKHQLIAIKQGKYSQESVFEMYNDLKEQCDMLLRTSTLPEIPDVNLLSREVARAYRTHWMNNEYSEIVNGIN